MKFNSNEPWAKLFVILYLLITIIDSFIHPGSMKKMRIRNAPISCFISAFTINEAYSKASSFQNVFALEDFNYNTSVVKSLWVKSPMS